MIISPIEIQKKEFGKSLRGYSQEEVREYLEDIAKSYETIYSENRELKEQIEDLKDRLKDYRSLEETLKNTLVLAEKTAEDVRNNSHHERELILKETMAKAAKIIEAAEKKYNDISCEIEELRRHFYLYKTRFTNFLKSQLELVESFEASDIADFDDIDLHLREVAIAWDNDQEGEADITVESLQKQVAGDENSFTEGPSLEGEDN